MINEAYDNESLDGQVVNNYGVLDQQDYYYKKGYADAQLEIEELKEKLNQMVKEFQENQLKCLQQGQMILHEKSICEQHKNETVKLNKLLQIAVENENKLKVDLEKAEESFNIEKEKLRSLTNLELEILSKFNKDHIEENELLKQKMQANSIISKGSEIDSRLVKHETTSKTDEEVQGWELNEDDIQFDANVETSNTNLHDLNSNLIFSNEMEKEKILLEKEHEKSSHTNELERIRDNFIKNVDKFKEAILFLTKPEDKKSQNVELTNNSLPKLESNQTENVAVKERKRHSPVILSFLMIFTFIYFGLLCLCLYNRDKSNEETFEMYKKMFIDAMYFVKAFLLKKFSLLNN